MRKKYTKEEIRQRKNDQHIAYKMRNLERFKKITAISSRKQQLLHPEKYVLNSFMYRARKLFTNPQIEYILANRFVAHCEICGKKSIKALNADHNHATKKFRGLLCGNCNKMLGLIFDDVKTLEAAIRYLKKHVIGTSNQFNE